MLKHYWTSAIRNLVRNKRFTIINIVGLSVSIAVFLVLNGYVEYQFSYDKFYEGGDQIYRVDYFEYQDGIPVLESSRTHDRTALLIHEYTPEVEAVTRIYNEKAYVFTDDVRIVDQDMLFADSSFFKVFPVKLIQGSPESALVPPKAVVISQSQAKVYFGDDDPMGKVLYFNERLPFTVTGVFEDIPETTSVDFDFLLSWSTMPFYGWVSKDGSFDAPYTFTYVRLRDGVTDISRVDAGLTRMANEHITSLVNRRHRAKQQLKAYEGLHVSKPLTGEIKPGVSKGLLYALVSLSIFMLVTAWINYINLSLAQSLARAGEIGVRKVFGASGFSISGQFLTEAGMLALSTFLIGCGIYYLFTQPLSHLFFSDMTFAAVPLKTWGIYFFGFVGGTTLVSFYPSYFMSRFKPVMILRNKLGSSRSRAGALHQGLMVFQLFLAIAVVGVTFIAGRQIEFMRTFDAGFNSTQTISLRAPASTNSDSLRYSRYTAFRNDVLQMPAFHAGTSTQNIPGQEIRYHDESVHAVGSDNTKKQSFSVMWTDEGYQETFGMSLVAGRNFNLKEGRSCIINETAAKALGYTSGMEAVNTSIITNDNQQLVVVGVWKDYHHESVHKPMTPIIFLHRHPIEYGYYSFRLESMNAKFLPDLERIWKKHYPSDTFTCYFMDSFFGDQYRSDQLFGKLMNVFSVISVTVACLGLFGMASLSLVRRTREIGIRKVLGASVLGILLILSRNYVRLVLAGAAIAFPVVWYVATQWLSAFNYHIGIQWWMVALPGCLVLVTSLITIMVQSIRTATMNPIKVLRDQ